MTTATNKQFIQDYHRDVIENGNLDLIDRYIAKSFTFHTPYLSYAPRGRDALRAYLIDVFSAFTQLKITTNEIIAEGNKASARWTIEGISTGDFMNIPAGGDSRIICVITHFHMSRGKIIEAWSVDSSMWPRVFEF